MPNITLLYSPSCGACPSAKSLWKELRVKYSFSYREVDITTPNGQELADRHSIRAVPATALDKARAQSQLEHEQQRCLRSRTTWSAQSCR